MERSESINELAAALAKAQGALRSAVKDSTNPAFRSKYADLTSVWEACRSALTAHGLSVTQMPHVEPETGRVSVTTMLLHTSGQFIASTLSIKPGKDDAHGIGSAITYARRFGLSAMVGITADDDDGNAAAERPAQQRTAAPVAPAGHDEWRDNMTAVADTGTPALQKAWKESNEGHRAFAGQDFIASLKARAQAADKKAEVAA
jgi:hypothetical protein